MKRRDFLKTTLAAAGGTALAGLPGTKAGAAGEAAQAVPKVSAMKAGGWYTPNRAPLRPTPFSKLPPGAVTPHGWLRTQLLLQAEGLNGRMPEVSDYLVYEGNGWVTPGSNVGWEEVTYWLKGHGDLGYVLGDKRVIGLATKWISGILNSQQPDGWFGPANLRTSLDGGPDMWPHMPALNALQSFYEHTSDPRVLPFMTKYFAFQSAVPGPQYAKSWAGKRFGDNIESIYWTYNRTGDESLLALARKQHENMADYTTGLPNQHNVDLSQGFREPATYWMQSGDDKHRAATYQDYDTLMGEYGQFAGGGFAGDENLRPGYGDPRQGFETCGIAELMHSFEMLSRFTGDPVWADRCEYIAFNSLPAALDPMGKVCHYITSANSIQLDNTPKGGDFQNSFPMQALKPGIHDYRCCPHNYGMAWPYYAEELWQATHDGGLCASLYGASEVRAKVGDNGSVVLIKQTTDYPFSDTVEMRITAVNPVAFPLYLRVPRWCKSPTVRINGKPVAVSAEANSYVIVPRTWKDGDTVSLHLPMTTSMQKWEKNQNSVSVNHGPLSYSLAIGEKYTRYGGTERWPEYSVYATTPWNYALEPVGIDVVRKGGPLTGNPWTPGNSPVELRAKARKISNWQADYRDVITTLQPSPARTTEPVETVSLIPMGAARLRLTSFPTVGHGPDAHDWVAPVLPDFTLSASHVNDDLDALSNVKVPTSSLGENVTRFTWWDHKGTTEWVQYEFKTPQVVSGDFPGSALVKPPHVVSVYWFDDTGRGECRVPKSCRLLYKAHRDDLDFKPVPGASAVGTAKDAYNGITFPALTVAALRLEVQLQDGFSGGILNWRVDHTPAPTVPAGAI